jgi:hypothetical protein
LKNSFTSALKFVYGAFGVVVKKLNTFMAPLYPKYKSKLKPAMVTEAMGLPASEMGQTPP